MSKRRMGYLLEDGKIITLEEHDAKAKAEAVGFVIKLIHIFWKDWNKYSKGKLSKVAMNELEEYIRQQSQKEQNIK